MWFICHVCKVFHVKKMSFVAGVTAGLRIRRFVPDFKTKTCISSFLDSNSCLKKWELTYIFCMDLNTPPQNHCLCKFYVLWQKDVPAHLFKWGHYYTCIERGTMILPYHYCTVCTAYKSRAAASFTQITHCGSGSKCLQGHHIDTIEMGFSWNT